MSPCAASLTGHWQECQGYFGNYRKAEFPMPGRAELADKPSAPPRRRGLGRGATFTGGPSLGLWHAHHPETSEFVLRPFSPLPKPARVLLQTPLQAPPPRHIPPLGTHPNTHFP